MPSPLTADSLSAIPNIQHGFFTRAGGRSEGLYAGLNCGRGSTDDPVAVNENRTRVAALLGAHFDDVVTPYQVHSATAVIVDKPIAYADLPKADAVVTKTRGLAIGVLTADCGPVLFANRQGTVAAAAHAGWRGAIAGILEATLEAMQALGARRKDIIAATGPMINQDAYEVGPEFKTQFLAENPDYEVFFSQSARHQKPRFDLVGFIHQKLQESGITTIERISPCTYVNESLFYSFRRSQVLRQPDYGRQISAIVVT